MRFGRGNNLAALNSINATPPNFTRSLRFMIPTLPKPAKPTFLSRLRSPLACPQTASTSNRKKNTNAKPHRLTLRLSCEIYGLIMRPGRCVVRSARLASRMKPKPKPQQDLSSCRTCRIKKRVPRRCGAAGHERLMKFVERRIPRCNRQRRNHPAELPFPMLSSQRAQQ